MAILFETGSGPKREGRRDDTWKDLINMPILESAGKHDGTADPCQRWGVILAAGDGTRLLPLTNAPDFRG